MGRTRISFSIFGVELEIVGTEAGSIAKHFDFFTDRQSTDAAKYKLILEISPDPIDLKELPSTGPIKERENYSLYLDSNGCYIYHYAGKAFIKISRGDDATYAMLKAVDRESIHFFGYDFLINELCQFLDMQGLHCFPTFSLALPNGKNAQILTSPENADIAFEFVKQQKFRILSTGLSLVDKLGYVHAFPLMISLPTKSELPEQWQTKTIVAKYPNKPVLLLPISAIGGNSLPTNCEKVEPGLMILIDKSKQKNQLVCKELSKAQAALHLWKKLLNNENQYGALTLNSKKIRQVGMVNASRLAAISIMATRYKTVEILSQQSAKNTVQYIEENVFSLI